MEWEKLKRAKRTGTATGTVSTQNIQWPGTCRLDWSGDGDSFHRRRRRNDDHAARSQAKGRRHDLTKCGRKWKGENHKEGWCSYIWQVRTKQFKNERKKGKERTISRACVVFDRQHHPQSHTQRTV